MDGGPGPLTPMTAKQARFETSGEIAKFYEIAPNTNDAMENTEITYKNAN